MELVPVSARERSVLLALNEYYVYDFSELLGLDVRDSGSYGGERLERHFTDPLCHPWLIRVDGKLAGFAIHEGRSRLTGETGIHDVAEFFVLKKYRRHGIGTDAAIALFDQFKGRWEVRQVTANTSATSFWRHAINRYTAGHYEDLTWNDANFKGAVQRFDSFRSSGQARRDEVRIS